MFIRNIVGKILEGVERYSSYPDIVWDRQKYYPVEPDKQTDSRKEPINKYVYHILFVHRYSITQIHCFEHTYYTYNQKQQKYNHFDKPYLQAPQTNQLYSWQK